MSTADQSQGFKAHSEAQLSPLNSTRQVLQQKPIGQSQLPQQPAQQPSRVRHVYLEQQNTYGRFVPFLLLKDKLHSDIDNSGHTALHHMCSHNSQYLPLYLSSIKENDPILNTKSKLGHTPLDVAGIYCCKDYVDMLKEKGAIDNGNVDHWAIQGGNIYNWTGHVDVNKKFLIHWAAYNDMPTVLMEFYRQGANLSEKDANDFAPIDLAVINKSYNSLKVLAQLGLRPKDELVKQSESKSIRHILDQANESQRRKNLKKLAKQLFIPIFCLLSLFLMYFTSEVGGFQMDYVPVILTLSLWIALRFLIKVQPQPRFQNTRYSAFYSDIICSEVNTKSNHFLYYLLNISTFLSGLITLIQTQTDYYTIAILYFVEFYITVVYFINSLTLTYSIAKNLTHEEMFESFKCKYLWKEIHYTMARKILFRKFNNPLDRGIKENFKRYFARNFC